MNELKTSSEIRESFLTYFEERGHTVTPSDSLVPSSDPTLLFTSAGMVQFKKHFLEEIKTDFTRAASSQKCFRTSDIDKVGLTLRHLTFFEMLGNFSFGDYFKEDAILWGWEYLTKICNLSKEKLYASVYEEDDESCAIWRKFIPEHRIIKLGEDTNFWHMGPTGPCGPCSEILWDMGEKFGCGKPSCGPGCDCDRYLELWNLVFTQFNRKENGALVPLPKKNIDTGMGLERLVYIIQGKQSPFETDLFEPLIREASDIFGIPYKDKKNAGNFRMIADHARATVFLVGDGILPSNEGRGYVLRRIMRRAIRNGKQMGCSKPFIYRLVPVVSSIMKKAYPELTERRENIASIVKLEEEKFLETLETGIRHLDELMKKYSKMLPGSEAFKLYDTYGFPLELTREIAREHNRLIDEDGFEKAMKQAQELSRKSWKGSGEVDVGFYGSMHKKYGNAKFLGYETLKVLSTVKAIFKEQNEIDTLKKNEEGELILDQTPFYGESGGQIGDQGIIHQEKSDIKVKITDTVKLFDGFIIHKVRVEKGEIKRGDNVSAEVDNERRLAIMRHHTATHLLHKALRQVLGKHVRQSGSLVAPDRFRFDYTHPGSSKKAEIARIEELVNNAILQNYPVKTSEITLKKARESGVMAIFGEKYGKKVRCVYVGEEINTAYSAELCAGTHMNATGGIGLFKILSDTSIASGVRRIEAIAGKEAYKHIKNTEALIDSWSEKLRVNPKDFGLRLEKLIQKQKSMEKEIEGLKNKLLTQPAEDYSRKIITINDLKVFFNEMNDIDPKTLRNQADNFRGKMNLDIVLLTMSQDGKSSFVITTNKKAQAKGLDAHSISKKFGLLLKGSGGGRQDFAQGGGKDTSLIPQALIQIKDYIKNKT